MKGQSQTTAVILAGGMGTRAADPTIPKLAQEVGRRSLLAWHLDLLKDSQIGLVLIVAGHLGQQVHALAASMSAPGLTVKVIQEEHQEGTVAALKLAAAVSKGDEFLVILGDILMAFPVTEFLANWRASGKSVAVAVHPSSHPNDSDAAFPMADGSVLVAPKAQPRDLIPNMSSTGLFAINRVGLERFGQLRDFGSDVLPSAAELGDLFAVVTTHYFKDTGTPDRLLAAQGDIDSGAVARRGSSAPRAALFLDRDGVINPALPEVYDPTDFALNPGVASAIGSANRFGLPVFVITNQPGIAKGFMTEQTHLAIRARLDALLGESGAFVDDYWHCPHHPDAGFAGEVPALKVACECRKPAPGLILAVAAKFGIDLGASVFVGDTWRDEQAALGAGIPFIKAPQNWDMGPSVAIVQAIERLRS
jgi:histidinol-phosphate phosphatase family protein